MTCILVFTNSKGYKPAVETNPAVIPAMKCCDLKKPSSMSSNDRKEVIDVPESYRGLQQPFQQTDVASAQEC
jgi:hypothetical protein